MAILTPSEQVTITRKAIAALERHDLDACMSMMTPDFSTIEPRFSGKVKRYSGAVVGDVNPDKAATGLLALADGLGIHVLSSALDVAAAQRLLLMRS